MSEAVSHTHAIHFGEKLTEAWERRIALSRLVTNLNNYHLGRAVFTQHGDFNTPEEKPVITGCFLPAELMLANQHGFTHRVVKPIERRELSI